MKIKWYKLYYNVLWLGMIIYLYKISEKLLEIGLTEMVVICYTMIVVLVVMRVKIKIR